MSLQVDIDEDTEYEEDEELREVDDGENISLKKQNPKLIKNYFQSVEACGTFITLHDIETENPII